MNNLQPNESTLILVPTQFELDLVQTELQQLLASLPNARVEICGFGPVASAARSMQLLERHRPRRVILIGIAGGYSQQSELGVAYEFDSVACHGIGIGDGADFQTAESAGWSHWPGDAESPAVQDVIPLVRLNETGDLENASKLLITVCGASQDQQDRDTRLSFYPHAWAEDMEGFSVGTACQISKIPLSVARGISNHVGNRDVKSWKTESAMRAAVQLVSKKLGLE